MNDVTQLLSALDEGDASAADRLLPLVYVELRRLAARRMDGEPLGQTLQPTALVHEAYVRLVDNEHRQRWQSRGHFFAAAAEAMRRILIDNARRKKAEKHGGNLQRVELCDGDAKAESRACDDLLGLDEVLVKFAELEPEKAKLVKLRYFAGLSLEESAEAMGISRATASRYWTYARAWLYDALRE